MYRVKGLFVVIYFETRVTFVEAHAPSHCRTYNAYLRNSLSPISHKTYVRVAITSIVIKYGKTTRFANRLPFAGKWWVDGGVRKRRQQKHYARPYLSSTCCVGNAKRKKEAFLRLLGKNAPTTVYPAVDIPYNYVTSKNSLILFGFIRIFGRLVIIF